LLIIAGSGQKMMHSTFLNGNEPLYGRSKLVYKMPYLDYKWYLEYLNAKHSIESFSCFSLLGGVPRYWLLSNGSANPVELADRLFFSDSAILQDEATRLLYDEGLFGNQPSLILDLIGRGATKPNDIASALAQSQGSLTKPLRQLLDIGLVKKENPFGQNPDNSKIVHLSITDPCLKFWYSVASPHKNRWHSYSKSEKLELIHLHASQVWEEFVRNRLHGTRYWEKNIELDSVSLMSKTECLVSEIKFSKLNPKKKANILADLELKWHQSNLKSSKFVPRFQVLDIDSIDSLDDKNLEMK
jgi:hypothetical protein